MTDQFIHLLNGRCYNGTTVNGYISESKASVLKGLAFMVLCLYKRIKTLIVYKCLYSVAAL